MLERRLLKRKRGLLESERGARKRGRIRESGIYSRERAAGQLCFCFFYNFIVD